MFSELVVGSSPMPSSITPKPLQSLELPGSPDIKPHAHPYPSLVCSISQPCGISRLEPVPCSGTCLGDSAAPWLGKSLAYQTVSESWSEGEFVLELCFPVTSSD